jgi:putative SOS response-associated peptidase YedK
MCNLYVPPEPKDIRLYFGVQVPIEIPYNFGTVAKMKPGPYVLSEGKGKVGQWGLIPSASRTREPMLASGRPMSTNNLRTENIGKQRTVLGPVWKRGQRCLIPAWSYDEPYWGHNDKNIWWRFAREDGTPWALAGVWNDWTDNETGEIVPSYSMLTMQCNEHPLLRLMHKPERDPDTKEILPMAQQDKRSVIPIERNDWQVWLTGSLDEAQALLRLPAMATIRHGAADPVKQVELPIEAAA